MTEEEQLGLRIRVVEIVGTDRARIITFIGNLKTHCRMLVAATNKVINSDDNV